MTALLRYVPNIDKPATFNEKIAHRKLHEYDPRFAQLADKWAVRSYVAQTIGTSYLNEVYGVFSSAAEVRLAELPERFVAKPTHGSKSIAFVDGTHDVDERGLQQQLDTWLRRTYGVFQNEYWYREIQPRIIIERRLSDSRFGVPLDFKLYVFHGRVQLIQVDSDRHVGHKRTLYDREWVPQQVEYAHPIGPVMERPAKLEEMRAVAEALGTGFDFVRVDLYSPDNERIVFGEMTFAPEAGRRRFIPSSFDMYLGSLW